MTDIPRSRRAPAVGPALVGTLILAAFAGILRASRPILATQDNWWAWDVGRRILREGLFGVDPYTFTRGGEPWRLHQWLANLTFGGAEALGGFWLLAVVVAVIAAAAYLQLGLLLQRRAPGFVGLVGLALAATAAPAHISMRGTLFSLLLVPPLLWLILRPPSGRRIVGLLILFVLWGNLHGGALIGAGLLLVHEIGHVIIDGRSRVRPAVAVFGAAIVGMCVTPYGPLLLVDNLRLAAEARDTRIVEWLPPRLLAPSALAFTVLLVLAIVAFALAGHRDRLPEGLLVAAAVILAMTAVRNVITMAMVIAVVSAPAMSDAWNGLRRSTADRPPGQVRAFDRVLAFVIGLIGLVGMLVVVPRSDDVRAHAADTPIDLIEAQAAEGRGQRLFSMDSWAMAASILGGPVVATFYDGRVELLGDLQPTYATIIRASPDWDTRLDEHCVTDLLIPNDGPLYDAAIRAGAWKNVGTQELHGVTAAWLTRSLPANC